MYPRKKTRRTTLTSPYQYASGMVYQEWKPEPVTIDEEIRYSIPHWEYLCNLLKA